jgi:hypothetical protein
MRAADLSEAVRRYRLLADRADDLSGAYRQLGDRRNQLADRLTRCQGALDGACQPYGAEADEAGLAHRRHREGKTREPKIDGLAADVAAARKALAEVDARRAALAREREPLAGLAVACKEHLKKLGWREPRL